MMQTPIADRKIIHIDMDAFYASVEQRDRPDLKGKPVIVGGPPQSRGVVATCSYEARKFGVHSAMPSSQAYRLCPNAIFVRPRFDAYKAVSQQIREIFYDYTDLVEPLSLDEAYLDITENKVNQPSATLLAREIRNRIWEETNLTASAGVSYNKFLAKVASDLKKPNGLSLITPEQALDFIAQLPIKKFFGIGKKTAAKLKKMGIETGADLREYSREALIRRFGKAGKWYYQIVRGIDKRVVNPHRIVKSVSVEDTFGEDLTRIQDLHNQIDRIAKTLAERLARKNKSGRTVTLKVKYDDFTQITRSQSFTKLMKYETELAACGKSLLEKTEAGERPVRLLGLGVSNFPGEAKEGPEGQLEIPFPEEEQE